MKDLEESRILQLFESSSKVTGFRLDDDHRLTLFSRAYALKMTPSNLARLYVIERLHESNEREEIRNAIISLGQELVEVRKDIAVSSQELLVSAGKATASQAERWRKENLWRKEA